MTEEIQSKDEKAKKQEAAIINCYVNLPPDEKLPFVKMIEFVAVHSGSGRLLRDARTKGLEDISEIFAYLLDHWVDPEPLH